MSSVSEGNCRRPEPLFFYVITIVNLFAWQLEVFNLSSCLWQVKSNFSFGTLELPKADWSCFLIRSSKRGIPSKVWLATWGKTQYRDDTDCVKSCTCREGWLSCRVHAEGCALQGVFRTSTIRSLGTLCASDYSYCFVYGSCLPSPRSSIFSTLALVQRQRFCNNFSCLAEYFSNNILFLFLVGF